MCKKAMKKMWVLRRLNKFNIDSNSLIDVYMREIRSLVEMAAPVWHSGLTKKQEAQIERVQKTALFLILGSKYTSYKDACSYCGLDSLKQRSFAKKDSQRDKSFFKKANRHYNTRNVSNIFIEHKCRTSRFKKSSLPYLAKLLNTN